MKVYIFFLMVLMIMHSAVVSFAEVEEDRYCERIARSEASFSRCLKTELTAKRNLAKLKFPNRLFKLCATAVPTKYASYQGLYNCIYANMVAEQVKTEVESVLPPTASRAEIEQELQRALARVRAYMQAQQYED